MVLQRRTASALRKHSRNALRVRSLLSLGSSRDRGLCGGLMNRDSGL